MTDSHLDDLPLDRPIDDERGPCDDCGFLHYVDQGDECLPVGPWPCNHCGAPTIYAPDRGWYYHLEQPECFLAGSPEDLLLERLADLDPPVVVAPAPIVLDVATPEILDYLERRYPRKYLEQRDPRKES